MKCPFCKGKKDEENTNFDNPKEHIVIVINKEGHTHVHAPFANEFIIREMMKSLIAEMENRGIKYRPATEDRIGN